MSHFTVLVIGEDIASQLAPFQENNMNDCPKQYLAFNDIEDEHRAQYGTDTTACFVSPQGEAHCKYDQQFADRSGGLLEGTKYKCPDGWTEREVPVREIYPTFEEYMSEHCGSRERDPVIGRYGYWENPNARWDWYSVGGRWTGFFKLKPGASGETGSPGLMTPEASDGHADSVLKRDIDIDGMRAAAGEKAAAKYDAAMAILSGLPANVAWEEARADSEVDAARERYWAQPRCAAWKAAEKLPAHRETFGWDESPDSYLISRDQYIQNARDSAIQTFAVLKDGKWHERGKMGWFASVSDEKDPETWTAMFTKLIDSLPDDTRLTVVDCHI